MLVLIYQRILSSQGKSYAHIRCFLLGLSLVFLCSLFGSSLGLAWASSAISLVFLRCFIGVSLVKKQRNSKGIRIYKITWFLP